MSMNPLLVALQVGESRRVLRCYALDQEGFQVPDPEGLETGTTVTAQLRSTAGGRRQYAVQARLAFLSDGRARFVFQGVPGPMLDAILDMATRCGVYRGTKTVAPVRAKAVRSTPFGALDSVEERLLVDVPASAFDTPEVLAQIRRGMFRVRHSSPPTSGTPVAVRIPLSARESWVMRGSVTGVSGDEFWIEIPHLDPEFLAALDKRGSES